MKKAKKPAKPKTAKFRAIDVEFDWSNEEWIRTFLLPIRIASKIIDRDDNELQKMLANHIEDGTVTAIVESWLDTEKHLRALTDMLHCVLARYSIVLKRMGHEPAKPPVSRKESRT
jgi:hypothetical protein